MVDTLVDLAKSARIVSLRDDLLIAQFRLRHDDEAVAYMLDRFVELVEVLDAASEEPGEQAAMG